MSHFIAFRQDFKKSTNPFILYLYKPVYYGAICICLLLITAFGNLTNAQSEPAIHIIPRPVSLVRENGQLDFSKGYYLELPKRQNAQAKLIRALLETRLSRPLTNRPGKNNALEVPVVRLELDKHLALTEAAAYQLDITGQQVLIRSRTEKGLFYGVQTLLQLPGKESHKMPLVHIKDYPRFGWRGFMLDVSRHFYTVEEIKKLLDVMAAYKLNVFHWHLTDDQGWRLQIKRYPKLTSVGAWREEKPGAVFFSKHNDTLTGNPYRYGGFYSQAQAREIVAYGAARNITIIPEIEMPGHSEAALAAYPEYSCSGKPQTVANSMGFPRDAQSEFNPANEATFNFLENILKEVMSVFPSEYIHIGGDEVDKTHWNESVACQNLMKKAGLKDAHELQSYFINRIEKFLKKHHRKLVGWDETLEGNLSPSAVITYWRSYAKKAPLKAVSAGHPFINVCSDPMYFNRYQAGPEGEPMAAPHSMNTLERVYNYSIMPAGFTQQQQKLVLGGEAAIWTEFFASGKEMEYMLLPRLMALSENLWTVQSRKDYQLFFHNLPRQLDALGKKGYNYRPLDPK